MENQVIVQDPSFPARTLQDHARTLQDHARTFHSYVQKDKSNNSLRAYRFGWKKFTDWMDIHSYILKPDPDHAAFLVGSFLSDMAKQKALKYKSIVAYHAAIKHHLQEEMNIELDHPKLKSAMRGIRKELKQSPVKKEAIKAEHFASILPVSDKLIDIRDRALLLIGFSGAFRRSELVGIDIGHLTHDPEGISIYIPFSKTDQAGDGRHVEIPRSENSVNCPVLALENWLRASGIKKGPVFRSISKQGVVSEQQLSGKAVSLVVKKHAGGFFDSEKVAGHSLRRGFVTSAIEADVPAVIIMATTGQKSINTLKEYFSEKKNYKTNALNSIKL